MSKYEPKPGTVAYRALAYLGTLDRGAEVTTSALCERLGVDAATLSGCLQPALDHRAVFKRQREKRFHNSPKFWSLVDHEANRTVTPPPGPQTPIHSKPEAAQSRAAAPATAEVAADSARLAAREAVNPAREREAAANSQPAGVVAQPAQAATEIRTKADAAPGANHGRDKPLIALWSDGTLEVLRLDGSVVVFTPDEGMAIVEYLGARR